jgi:mono/diheme cytochrome c family protein
MKTQTTFVRLTAFVAVVLILMIGLMACSSTPAASTGGSVPKPSNAGSTGPAVNLTGDAGKGATIFTANCVACHGDQGKTGIPNPGSTRGSVPNLNPIDSGLYNADAKVFAANLDLFIEHGSKPAGDKPALSMLAFGDLKTLSAQDIADVMAYVISLNKK